MKVIFVQLAYEASEVAMLEMFGQNSLGEFLALGTHVSSTGATAQPKMSALPPGQRNYRPHHPSVLWTRRKGPPTFYRNGQHLDNIWSGFQRSRRGAKARG